MLNEFKAFISRGNVIDLAVGIIIGAAFTGIVNSLVNDVIMPVIGLLMSGIDFSNIFIPLSMSKMTDAIETVKQAKDAGVPVMAIGVFINTIINFLIVSFVIFMIVKQVNRFKKAEESKPVPTPEETLLLREIRDSLKK